MNKPSIKIEFRNARRGRVTPLLLFLITVTFICGILIINSFFVMSVRVEQENATDAAALAAAEVLACEAFLYGDPSIYAPCPVSAPKQQVRLAALITEPVGKSLFCEASLAAIEFASKNFVSGKPLELRPHDVVFSVTDIPERVSRASMPAGEPDAKSIFPPLTLAQKRHLNAVQVYGRNAHQRGARIPMPMFTRMASQVASRSEAVLDGYVYGFHTDPDGDINIPLAPIGLNERSWREQVELPVDRSCETPANGRLPFGDFKVLIGSISHDPDVHDSKTIAPLLFFGTTTIAQATGQLNPLAPGITPAQYVAFVSANDNKPLALDPNTLQLKVPASPHSHSQADNLHSLEANLSSLKTKETRLIWPLISGYNDSHSQKKANISGFVAARVINVKRLSYHLLTDQDGHTVRDSKKEGTCDDGFDNDGRRRHRYEMLELTLHPSLLATSTGIVFVQDWPDSDQHPYRFPNAYVKKIRLIK